MSTLAEVRAVLNAISRDERPNVGQASPVALEAWRETRPDLTFEQFVELLVQANVATLRGALEAAG